MVAPFEDAVYAMKKGDVTNTPVRTQYGLHIIRVTDRKPSVGQIQAAHIMVRFDRPDPAPEDTLAALAKARTLHDSLRAGADFAELAKRHSGDPGSASMGGDLGVFSRRRWIQEFDEVAFTLAAGQVSDVVRTRYGYHLIKCLAVFPPKPYEESKTELKNQYQPTRFQDDFKAYLDSLKRASGYAVDQQVMARFLSSLDSTRSTRDSAWWASVPADVRSATLITVGGRRTSVDSVVSLLRARPDLASTALRAAPMQEAVGRVGEQILFTQRADRLEKESPEFAATMQEYREGILLYQIEQERVWKRVSGSVNDSTLKAYHAANADRFVWPDRVRFSSVQFGSDVSAAAAVVRLRAGATFEELARADGERLAAQTMFSARFGKGSATVIPAVKDAAAPAVKELAADAAVRIQLTAQPDTLGKSKKKNIALADRRLQALQKYLADAAGVPAQRISVVKHAPASTLDREARARVNDEVLVEVLDRRPTLLGPAQTEVLPVTADERTQKANALTPGGYTDPFAFRGATTIVRLEDREPARAKTFDEASTEVSSSYQDHEAKRLETEWIAGLQKKYPVVKKPEELQKAFAEQPAK
jgi:peptidyl-prolyl cis-trans isomerase SurA